MGDKVLGKIYDEYYGKKKKVGIKASKKEVKVEKNGSGEKKEEKKDTKVYKCGCGCEKVLKYGDHGQKFVRGHRAKKAKKEEKK